MPTQKTITVYEYSELSDKAKENARNWFNSIGDDWGAWENTKEDAKEIGLELHGTHRGSMEGEFIDSAIKCANSILLNHGSGCDTYQTAEVFSKEYNRVNDGEETEETEEKLEELIERFLQAILEDYRIYYEKEIEYQYSEEFIAETMDANEYEFDVDGKRI